MGRLVHQGQSIKVSVPAGTDTIDQGDFVYLQGFFGMAFQTVEEDAVNAQDLILNVETGVYETSQITGADAFAKGDLAYFDPATLLLTTNSATVGVVGPVGVVETAKVSGVVRIKLGAQTARAVVLS